MEILIISWEIIIVGIILGYFYYALLVIFSFLIKVINSILLSRFILTPAPILPMTQADLSAISAILEAKAQLFGALNVTEKDIAVAALVHGEIDILFIL